MSEESGKDLDEHYCRLGKEKLNLTTVRDTEGTLVSFDTFSPESVLKNLAELAYKLLTSLPRLNLATIQRRIASLLQFDIVGVLIYFQR